MKKQEELLKLLLQSDSIQPKQLKEAAKESKKNNLKIEDVLVNKKFIDLEKLMVIKAKLFEMEYEDLSDREIDEEVMNIFSHDVAENYKIICFEKEDKDIKVGIVDPENFKAREAVDFLAKEKGLKVKYYLISNKSFKTAIQKYKSLAQELSTALQTRAESEEELLESDKKDKIELKEITKSAPVVKIVSVIIRHAVEGRASDIHIEPLDKESRVRYRIDGVLHTSLVLPKSIHSAVVARIKVMANMKLDETRIPQDGRIRLVIDDKDIDFRVSTLPLIDAEKVVMRILDTTKGAPKLEELGFEGVQLQVIQNNIKKTEGIILVTGPTGSGKSTTLFSVLDLVNKEGVNIATLEDPVEYKMKGINQSQIKPEIGYTFASGLRSFLRQDPDIIMVGEIRDKETAELAIHAALTGHLVFSTLHTTNAPGAITRLVDMGVEEFLLGSTLRAVVAQRLARRICPHCQKEFPIPKDYIDDFNHEIEKITVDYIKTLIKDFDPKNLTLFKGKGCPRCGNSGYSGRVAINEVLDITDEIRDQIIGGEKSLSREDINENQKFLSVKQDGYIKALQGVTTIEDVLRVMRD